MTDQSSPTTTTTSISSYLKTKTVQEITCALLLCPLLHIRIIKQTSPEYKKFFGKPSRNVYNELQNDIEDIDDESRNGLLNTLESIAPKYRLWNACSLLVLKDLPSMLIHHWYRTTYQQQQHSSSFLAETCLLTSLHMIFQRPFDNLFTRASIMLPLNSPTEPRDHNLSYLSSSPSSGKNDSLVGKLKNFVKQLWIVGCDASILQQVTYRTTFLVAYESRDHLLSYFSSSSAPTEQQAQAQPLWKLWLFYQVVSTMASAVSYPFDTVYRRMIAQSHFARVTEEDNDRNSHDSSGDENKRYRNVLHAMSQIVREEGIASLYKGFWLNRLTNIMSAAISLGTLMIMEQE